MPSRTLVKPQDVLSTELVKLKQLQRQSVAPTGSQRNLTTEKVLQAIEDLKQVQAEQGEIIAELDAAIAILDDTVERLDETVEALDGTLAIVQDTVDYLESLTVSKVVGSPSQTGVSSGTWGGDRPAMAFKTSTGKIRVTVSAWLVSVSPATVAAATFSIDDHVSRESQITAITSGGSGTSNCFATNGFGSGSFVGTVEGLPVDTLRTIRFECYAHNGNIGYSLPQLIVETIP